MDLFLKVLLLLPPLLVFIGVALTHNYGLDDEQKRFRKSKVEFFNQLFVCRESGCDIKFFRVYQAVEGILERKRRIVDYSFESNQFDYEKELFEEDMVCPCCLSGKVEEVEQEFDWMKKDDGFRWLDYKALEARRKAFYDDKEQLRERIKEIKALIDEKESVESFQWHYGLDSEKQLDIDMLSTKRNIIEQLEKLKKMTPHVTLHDEIDPLIERLNVTPEEKYGKKVDEVPEELEEQVQREDPEPVRRTRRFSLFNINIYWD